MCLAKLRVSYEFNDMCKKSHKKLQGYLKAILSKNNEEKIGDFINTDLNVVVTPLRGYEDEYCTSDNPDCEVSQNEVYHYKEKRKRITKEQRCSLLKRLLTSNEVHKKTHDNYFYNNYYKSTLSENNAKGGLRNIIDFTNNYEFGNYNKQFSPLDKLKAFSEQFFKTDFTDFRNTILYIIENKDNLSDSGDSENEFYDTPDEDEVDTTESIVKFEEVIVEPDVKIKTELEYEEEGSFSPYKYYGEYGDFNENEANIKMEEEGPEDSKDKISLNSVSIPHCSDPYGMSTSNSMQILNNFVGSYTHRRSFSSYNVRCRTRDNPYINPLLREQFLYRSFKCHKCSRYFKSQGYLKAHYTKIH